MRKLEIADADVMRIAIQQEIQRSEESRYDHRLHGLLLITAGQSCQQVAELFGEDRRTVQRWVKTFEEQGLDGLREGDRPGRPRSLTPQQWKLLGKDLRKSPDKFGLTGHLWDGKLFSPRGGVREDVTFFLLDGNGDEIRRERRLLRIAPQTSPALALEPARQQVAPGGRFMVTVRATGAAAVGTSISVATYTEDHYNEERVSMHTDEKGMVRLELEAPAQETMLTLLAFEDDPEVPPAERQAAWAVVEVREP